MLVYFVKDLHGYHDACGNNKRPNRQCAPVHVRNTLTPRLYTASPSFDRQMKNNSSHSP